MTKKEIKILQIEDNPGDARLIYEMLKDITEPSYIFEHITDLTQGKERLAANDIDIILLDLGLVESTGITTLQKLSSYAPQMPPIIVMTGLNDENSGIEAVKQGAQDYLLKNTVTSELLNRSIHYALERSQTQHNLNMAYADLDKKVKERTAKLSETVASLEKEITEHKKTEAKLQQSNKALEEAKEKAEESNRLKSAFLSNMSHEIRTPMNGIIGFTNLMEDPEITTEMQTEYVQMIKQSANRLLHTVSEIIELSEIESGQTQITKTQLKPSETLKHIYTILRKRAEQKKLYFHYKKSSEIENTILKTDKYKLEYILAHLIENSIKFTEKGSIEFSAYIEETSLVFYVKDTGIGIPENKINMIFDNFVQADIQYNRGYEGSGLGLSIARAYVKQLNGKIWVESSKDKGSTFYVSIPLPD